MSLRDPRRITDGFTTLESGVDSGNNPSILPPNKCAYAVNVTFRNGFANTRPKFMQTILRFESQDAMDWFENHHVQGGYFYQASDGDSFLILSIGGRIFKVDPDEPTSQRNCLELTISGDANASNRPHVWMEQAEEYLIIQDGQSIPLIFDGTSLRRSRNYGPLYEVPVGCMMAYGNGRLAVVRPTLRSYVIGDLIGSGKEVIQFTETNFLAEGGDVHIPIPGYITAMKYIAVLDNSTGQGELVIHTSFGCVTAAVGELRTTWKDIRFQRIAQLEHGALSQNSTITVNGDMFYRAHDGLRSLSIAQKSFNTSWVNSPISNEANRVIDFDDHKLLDYSNAVLFDNRVLLSISPTREANRTYHRGILALDFDLITSMSEKKPPAYDLLWTGLRPSLLLVGTSGSEETCYAVHYNDDGKNEIWQIMDSQGADNDTSRVQCSLETRSMDYKSQMTLKKLESADLFVDNIQGQVDFVIQYRPDQYPCWFDWHSWSECSTIKDCTLIDGCLPLMNLKPQYRSRMILPQPPDGCETGDNKPRRLGYEFQAKLSWTGVARIKAMRVHAYDQMEVVTGCVTDSACRKDECCIVDALSYSVASEPNEVI